MIASYTIHARLENLRPGGKSGETARWNGVLPNQADAAANGERVLFVNKSYCLYSTLNIY